MDSDQQVVNKELSLSDLAQDAALAACAILRQRRDERCLHPIVSELPHLLVQGVGV